MKEQRKTPKLRFPGFTDDWEQRKFKDLFSSFANKDFQLQSSEYCDRGRYPIIDQGKKKIIGYSDNRTKVCDKFPCIIFGDHTTELKYIDFPFIIGADGVKTLSVLEGNALFQYYNLQVNNIQPTGYNRHFSMLKEISLYVPNLEEQEKIGTYFDNLDNLITLHQRKCDAIKELKKGMLQKMFPKNGEKVPEVRFPGFTDDWEQRKLEDIYGSIGNAYVGTATPYYVEQGHFYLESNNIKDGQINHNSEIFINDEFYEKQKDKWLHTGDMVMVQSGHVGHAAVIPEELDNTAAHALIMFRNPKEEIEPYFLNFEYQTDKAKKKIENITTGNTIKHILASEMQNFIVDVPKYEEQKVIAGYFRNIDTLITLHQRKVEKLKEMKKGLLQQMFV